MIKTARLFALLYFVFSFTFCQDSKSVIIIYDDGSAPPLTAPRIFASPGDLTIQITKSREQVLDSLVLQWSGDNVTFTRKGLFGSVWMDTLAANTTKYYRFVAYRGAEIDTSNTSSATVGAFIPPYFVSALPDTLAGNLTWAYESPADSAYLLKGKAAGALTFYHALSGSQTAYTDTIAGGEERFYKLYIKKYGYTSDTSAYISVSAIQPVVAAPETTIVYENMIANPGFETDLTGWELFKLGETSTFTRSISGPLSGTASAILAVTATGTNNGRPRVQYTANLSRTVSTDTAYTWGFKYHVVSGTPKLTYCYMGGTRLENVTLSGDGVYETTDTPGTVSSSFYIAFDGQNYTFEIQIDSVFCRPPPVTVISNPVPVTLTPLYFTAAGDSFKVNYSWVNPETYDSIHIYVGNTSGSLSLYTTLPGTDTAWVLSGLPHNTTKYAKAIAEKNEVQSTATSIVSATTVDTTTYGPSELPEYYQTPQMTGVNWYLSSTGTAGGDGTTPATAWDFEGLNNNWFQISGGDAINFAYGDNLAPTYDNPSRIGIIRIPNSFEGDANNWLIFRAYGDTNLAKPVISDDNCTGYFQLIRSGAMRYVAFENLDIDGEIYLRGNDNVSMGLQFIKLLSCTIRNKSVNFYNAFASYMSNVPDPNLTWAKIQDISVYNCTFISPRGNGGCINVSGWERIRIGYNTFYDVQEEAIDIAGGDDHLIEYNLISGPSVNGIKIHSQFRPFRNAVVRGNVILHAASTATGLVCQNISGCQIYNNTIYSSYAAFFGHRDRQQPETYYGNFENNYIANNIFFGTVQFQGSWSTDPFGQGFYNTRYAIFTKNTFTNNTVWDIETSAQRWWENPGYPSTTESVTVTVYTSSQTNFAAHWGSYTTEDKMRNPLFVNASWTNATTFGDFSLDVGSPEIGTGTPIPGWTRTFTGSTPTNPPNRGAY